MASHHICLTMHNKHYTSIAEDKDGQYKDVEEQSVGYLTDFPLQAVLIRDVGVANAVDQCACSRYCD